MYEFNSNVTGIADGEWLAFFVRERGSHRGRDLREHLLMIKPLAPASEGSP